MLKHQCTIAKKSFNDLVMAPCAVGSAQLRQLGNIENELSQEKFWVKTPLYIQARLASYFSGAQTNPALSHLAFYVRKCFQSSRANAATNLQIARLSSINSLAELFWIKIHTKHILLKVGKSSSSASPVQA